MRYPLPLWSLAVLILIGCADESTAGHSEALAAPETPAESVADSVEAPEEAAHAAREATEATPEAAEPIPTHDTPPPAPCTQAWFEYEQAQMAGAHQGRLTESTFLTRCRSLPEDTRSCLVAGYANGHATSCRERIQALAPELRTHVRDLGATLEVLAPSE